MPDEPPPAALTTERGYAVGRDWQGEHATHPADPGEVAPELQWPESVYVYDKMRRTDAQVAATLRAIRLSVGRLNWQVDPGGADPDVTAFVARNLGLPVLGDDQRDPPARTRGRFSFHDHLRMAMLMVIYGHFPFEQRYEVVEEDGRWWAYLRKLGPRFPQTISAINVARDGGLESVEQYPLAADFYDRRRRGGIDNIEIKVDRLVFYSFEREGGIWTGQSVIRPVYKNWLLKDRLLRVDTLAVERNGMGVPWIESSPGATKQQVEDNADIAAALRAGDEAGGAGPAGTKLSLVGVSGQLPDTLARIKYHDEQIARNLFAQFLDLGASAHGNRALGESFIDFFLMAVDAIAREFSTTFNPHVVEDLVDVNFGEDEPAPSVVPSVAKERHSLSAAELVALAQAGMLKFDPELHNYIRERYGLPMGDPGEYVDPDQQPNTPKPQTLPGDSQPVETDEEREPAEGMDT